MYCTVHTYVVMLLYLHQGATGASIDIFLAMHSQRREQKVWNVLGSGKMGHCIYSRADG